MASLPAANGQVRLVHAARRLSLSPTPDEDDWRVYEELCDVLPQWTDVADDDDDDDDDDAPLSLAQRAASWSPSHVQKRAVCTVKRHQSYAVDSVFARLEWLHQELMDGTATLFAARSWTHIAAMLCQHLSAKLNVSDELVLEFWRTGAYRQALSLVAHEPDLCRAWWTGDAALCLEVMSDVLRKVRACGEVGAMTWYLRMCAHAGASMRVPDFPVTPLLNRIHQALVLPFRRMHVNGFDPARVFGGLEALAFSGEAGDWDERWPAALLGRVSLMCCVVTGHGRAPVCARADSPAAAAPRAGAAVRERAPGVC